MQNKNEKGGDGEHRQKGRNKTVNRWGGYNYQHRKLNGALAGVAQWIEHGPVKQRVSGSIPSQGTCPGCGPRPLWGACKRQLHIDVSLPLFLSPLPSLSK